MKHLKQFLTLGISFILLLAFIGQAAAQNKPEGYDNRCSGKDICQSRVQRVVDGDTVVLDTGERVRYIGIDTPESVKPKSAECFGKEAAKKNAELVEGKDVKLVRDVSDTDKFGRLLRYVYQGDLFVNEYLIANGYANAVSYPPDIRYQAGLEIAEETAKQEKKGFWADNACQETKQSGNETENNIIARLQEDFILVILWLITIIAGSLWVYVKKR